MSGREYTKRLKITQTHEYSERRYHIPANKSEYLLSFVICESFACTFDFAVSIRTGESVTETIDSDLSDGMPSSAHTDD